MPVSGLANRIRAIASGVALARKTGRDPIVVWHRDSGLNAPFEAIFKTDSLPFQLRETGALSYGLVYDIPRKRNLYLSALAPFFDRRLRIFQDANKGFDSEESRIESIVASSGRDIIIQSGFEFYKIDRALLNSIFHISDRVKRRMDEILGGEAPEAALQIRRTDNAKSISFSPLSSFDSIARRLVDSDPGIRIFLATDDGATKDFFRRTYPANVVLNPAEASRSTVEGIVDAAAELYIMAECRDIYGSYWSSYSEIAAMIGGSRLTVVKS